MHAARDAAGQVVLRVRDTGIGIAPQMLPKVFELFVQESQALDRARGGLGLGLDIVKNLVESHGGTVSVHSEGQGRGSEFVVSLPDPEGRPSIPTPDSSKTGHPKPVASGHRLLIVDDNVDAAEVLADILRTAGFECQIAADGRQRLEAVAWFQPALALLDIGLPGMNGYELAERIRARHPNVHVVALTGYGRATDKEAALAAGFDAHLTKPVDASTLMKTLQELLSQPTNVRRP